MLVGEPANRGVDRASLIVEREAIGDDVIIAERTDHAATEVANDHGVVIDGIGIERTARYGNRGGLDRNGYGGIPGRVRVLCLPLVVGSHFVFVHEAIGASGTVTVIGGAVQPVAVLVDEPARLPLRLRN